MTRHTLPWELLGAAVGAGLASGREIASFFGRYGAWGFAGIALATGMLLWLPGSRMPVKWRGRWPERLWRGLEVMLLVATGGAMLAGAGDVAALTLPVHGAYWLGMAGTLLLAWLLAQRTLTGLAWVGRGLLAALALLIVLGLWRKPMEAVALTEASIPMALLRGVTYGGFNAALLHPVMTSSPLPQREKQLGLLAACCMTAALLTAGNAVLLRHPALMGEAMPFVQLMAGLGQTGYALGAISLYLAVLSTLTACIRSLGGGWLTMAGIVLTALLGFTGVVDAAYPLLGGACTVMLAAMRLQGRSMAVNEISRR